MSLKMLALGDVMAGANIGHFERGIRTYYQKQYEDIIDDSVKDILFRDVDLLLYNFEYSLVAKNFDFKKLDSSIYSAPIDSLKLFRADLPKIVNVANNHFSQHGKKRAQYSKKVLIEKGFKIVGKNNTPLTIKMKDSLLKLWGASLIPDKKFCEEYFLSAYSTLLSDLCLPEKMDGEKWLITLHWGDEYIGIPSKEQIQLGYKLIDHGFDIIVGHHPHVIQPVEIYKEKLIAYSLGNFIFDQNFSTRTQKGIVLRLSVDKKITADKIFVTTQKNYKISKIKETSKISQKICANKLYYILLKMLRLYYRILMKIEVIINWRNVSPQTKSYMKKKIL